MTDQDMTVTITLPDVITVRVHDTYVAGRGDYIRVNPKSSVIMADFHGALAVIKAQFVKVSGPEAFMRYLRAEDHADTPMAIVGLINREIAEQIEAAVSGPLEWAIASPAKS
jgi:hypothetical protein